MKNLLTVSLLISSLSAFALDISISSRKNVENELGEILTEATITDEQGNRVSSSSTLRGSGKFTSTQYALIPATTKIKQNLLSAPRDINIEGSILGETTTQLDDDRVTFKVIKVLVREAK